jgi:hypothetical protein
MSAQGFKEDYQIANPIPAAKVVWSRTAGHILQIYTHTLILVHGLLIEGLQIITHDRAASQGPSKKRIRRYTGHKMLAWRWTRRW